LQKFAPFAKYVNTCKQNSGLHVFFCFGTKKSRRLTDKRTEKAPLQTVENFWRRPSACFQQNTTGAKHTATCFAVESSISNAKKKRRGNTPHRYTSKKQKLSL